MFGQSTARYTKNETKISNGNIFWTPGFPLAFVPISHLASPGSPGVSNRFPQVFFFSYCIKGRESLSSRFLIQGMADASLSERKKEKRVWSIRGQVDVAACRRSECFTRYLSSELCSALFFYILRHLSRYMGQTCQKVMGATTFSLCPFLIGFFRFLLAGGLLISGLTD